MDINKLVFEMISPSYAFDNALSTGIINGTDTDGDKTLIDKRKRDNKSKLFLSNKLKSSNFKSNEDPDNINDYKNFNTSD